MTRFATADARGAAQRVDSCYADEVMLRGGLTKGTQFIVVVLSLFVAACASEKGKLDEAGVLAAEQRKQVQLVEADSELARKLSFIQPAVRVYLKPGVAAFDNVAWMTSWPADELRGLRPRLQWDAIIRADIFRLVTEDGGAYIRDQVAHMQALGNPRRVGAARWSVPHSRDEDPPAPLVYYVDGDVAFAEVHGGAPHRARDMIEFALRSGDDILSLPLRVMTDERIMHPACRTWVLRLDVNELALYRREDGPFSRRPSWPHYVDGAPIDPRHWREPQPLTVLIDRTSISSSKALIRRLPHGDIATCHLAELSVGPAVVWRDVAKVAQDLSLHGYSRESMFVSLRQDGAASAPARVGEEADVPIPRDFQVSFTMGNCVNEDDRCAVYRVRVDAAGKLESECIALCAQLRPSPRTLPRELMRELVFGARAILSNELSTDYSYGASDMRYWFLSVRSDGRERSFQIYGVPYSMYDPSPLILQQYAQLLELEAGVASHVED